MKNNRKGRNRPQIKKKKIENLEIPDSFFFTQKLGTTFPVVAPAQNGCKGKKNKGNGKKSFSYYRNLRKGNGAETFGAGIKKCCRGF